MTCISVKYVLSIIVLSFSFVDCVLDSVKLFIATSQVHPLTLSMSH